MLCSRQTSDNASSCISQSSSRTLLGTRPRIGQGDPLAANWLTLYPPSTPFVLLRRLYRRSTTIVLGGSPHTPLVDLRHSKPCFIAAFCSCSCCAKSTLFVRVNVVDLSRISQCTTHQPWYVFVVWYSCLSAPS